MTEEEFSIVQKRRSHKKNCPQSVLEGITATFKMEVGCQYIKAVNIIEKLPDFTFKLFERRYYCQRSTTENVYEYYDTVNQKNYARMEGWVRLITNSAV